MLLTLSLLYIMASDKRNFTNFSNEDDFPGKINSDKNMYEFPTLYKTASTGKPRQWVIYCRLIKEDSMDTDLTKKQNWNELEETEVPMKQKYLENGEKVPDGIVAQIWTEGGIIGMKISRSAATYILEPKNAGKKNERNVLQQALVNMRSKYLKKIDDGSSTNIDAETELVVSEKTKYYPMLAKKYEDFIGKIKFPVYVQPKLDGNRCVVFLDTIDNPTYKNVIMYTRSHKELPYNKTNDAIRKALLDLLADNYHAVAPKESLFLDGELYMHNKSLQQIGSDAKGKNAAAGAIQYWVYDHFYPSYDKEPFSERVDILAEIYDELADEHKSLIKLLDTWEVTSADQLNDLYKEVLDENYEGLMIRTPDGPYLKSATKKSEQLRSKDLLKRKEVFDDEFEVVGFTDGNNGKEIGAVIWICKIENPVEGNGEFHVTPNMPLKERYVIYKECLKKFDTKYKGRMMTVEYRGLSDNGIPLMAKAIAFRDYK